MVVANDSSTVVVDIGTETYKIGYSDNGTPTRFGSSANIKNNYSSPVQNSTIVDLSSYLNILKNNIPEDTSYLFVAENTFEPLEIRSKILKFVMEENLCNSVLFMKSGLLDAFSYGRHNALVLSINGGSIQICTVLDGIITNRKMVNVGCLSLTKKFVRTP
ncbi:actin-like 53kDa protein [Nosema bombycis CQ1]|uniref:Actin-like 53kDa protein n=1 Tax=Nosema bombycis (strain CQ1 / CVCC 102059) TaxID=578461 RepID=R0MPZ8_NOSB1|nr:actin-like 53kDa protein [Nosema bombycis CQ1]|eukprot:EOB14928.1 actin-like 53kDa protein [Nosema bombycis CQ1]